MREALRVDIVQSKQHLLEVVLAYGIGKGAAVRDIVEELTTSDHFLLDVRDSLLLTALCVHDSLLFEVKVAHNTRVLKLSGRFDLFTQKFEGLLIEFRVFEVKDLQRILLTIRSLANFDLGRKARAKGLAECKAV